MPRIPGQIDVAKTEAILDAAVEVIGERGLAAPMEAIARRAGVSKQTVYNHYGSKADLMRALMTRRVESITASLREPGAVDNPTEALEAYARSMLETVVTNKSYSMMRVIMLGAGEMPDVAQEVFEAGPRAARRQLAAFLQMETELGRLKVENFEEAAEFFSGMVMGHSQMRSMLRLPSDKTPEEYGRLAREAAVRFMRAYAP
ncbi:TetR/AcrR family transcriptional regulator [Caulobacter sp. RL271]|jgi:AcrR family transcriptional regulator|uniref:TetR/AcrR family transcriptional regulator n=1 Tax=Caulobacter segnis TaxID=88688 RepID=A0ABY4ZTG5_9CAUL|nr:TetR/AcrR family transcriptional regulator [Caulobacter segnis]USQ95985.1 TetR/AcrR family transcriptional regulator [Caulobacter segnis]